jgi:hypothetical protein
MTERNYIYYTDTFKYLGMVCDKNINPTTAAGIFRVKKFVQETPYQQAARSHLAPQSLYNSCYHVHDPDLVHTFLLSGQRDIQPSSEVAA